MLQVRLDKRRMLALGGGLLLGACQVIPEAGAPPATTPTPGPSEPSANVLPTDSGRHRVALLVPLSGGNGADNITGGSGNDVLVGNSAVNHTRRRFADLLRRPRRLASRPDESVSQGGVRDSVGQ